MTALAIVSLCASQGGKSRGSPDVLTSADGCLGARHQHPNANAGDGAAVRDPPGRNGRIRLGELLTGQHDYAWLLSAADVRTYRDNEEGKPRPSWAQNWRICGRATMPTKAIISRADSAFGVNSVTLSRRRQSRSVIALIEGTGPPAAAR
jgi:hypothetical protein